jgi:hypothetical protein
VQVFKENLKHNSQSDEPPMLDGEKQQESTCELSVYRHFLFPILYKSVELLENSDYYNLNLPMLRDSVSSTFFLQIL